MRAVVVGGGSWGSAFARLLADRDHEVTLACRDSEQAEAIAETGRNPRYLPNVDLRDVTATSDIPEGAELYVLAVPSRAFAAVAAALPPGGVALSLTKGLDPATGERLSTLVRDRPVAVLSGPNMAEEIAEGLPSAAVIASEDEALAEELQHAINAMVFRVYVNSDLAGVELCAAAKNVIALAAGGVDGVGLGDNGKAALITRGLAEITRLARLEGAQVETLTGLAGLGDLVLTCTGTLSRNRFVGQELGKGRRIEEIAAELTEVAEGINTARAVKNLADRAGLEMPIVNEVNAVLYEGRSARDAVTELMSRPLREEVS